MERKYLLKVLMVGLFLFGMITGYLLSLPLRRAEYQMGFESGQESTEPCNPLDYCGEIEDNCWREVEMICSTLN